MTNLAIAPTYNNPQLKSCGSIEGTPSLSTLSDTNIQSATEKLRLHWRHLPLQVPINLYGNPQLKSCGSIEGLQSCLRHSSLMSSIRNWKVAAPLKGRWCNMQSSPICTIRNWKVAAPLKGLKFYHNKDWNSSIRNWKVAAPLKVTNPCFHTPKVGQSATEKLRLHWRDNLTYCHAPIAIVNPQLKSCGSIEGGSVKQK